MDGLVVVGGALPIAADASRRPDHSKYLWGILNAIVSGATNARAEGLNSRIQAIKRRACGYRNRERFRHAIYFHLGGLDLYQRPCRPPTRFPEAPSGASGFRVGEFGR